MAINPNLPLALRGVDTTSAAQQGVSLATAFGQERRTQEAFPLLQAGRQATVETAQLGLAQERGLAVVNTLKAIRALPIGQRAQAVQQSIPNLINIGVSRADIDSQDITDAGLDAEIAAGSGFLQQVVQTATQRDRADVQAGFTPEEIAKANRVEAGLDKRAGSESAPQIFDIGGVPHIFDKNKQVAIPVNVQGKDITAEIVGENAADIAQRKKFGELTASARAKAIDKGFDSIEKIDKNVLNMQRAITAIDDGASTGAIESRFFPSFREATLKLEALQKELSLDVIGAVTFGALSKGELDLAQLVALPLNLEPAALRQHLTDKITAQNKLRAYYAEQIDFLDQGGSVAGFLRSKRRVQPQPETAPQPANAGGGQGTVKFLGFE